jgi:hypothetical protein
MKAVLAAILGATCALALAPSTASAEIVCNREGDCWHVREVHHESTAGVNTRAAVTGMKAAGWKSAEN